MQKNSDFDMIFQFFQENLGETPVLVITDRGVTITGFNNYYEFLQLKQKIINYLEFAESLFPEECENESSN